jgi:large subunit ribosomal protein L22
MSTTTTTVYHATHRFARISVRKVRPLLDLIRGHYADDALDVMKYMPHRGARLIEQVLKSAMANAEEKGVRNVGELVVSDARGDGGPMFKRLMPRARGMAYLIRRRTAHIAIGLSTLEDWVAKPQKTTGQDQQNASDE